MELLIYFNVIKGLLFTLFNKTNLLTCSETVFQQPFRLVIKLSKFFVNSLNTLLHQISYLVLETSGRLSLSVGQE